jgi:hypothetical protein
MGECAEDGCPEFRFDQDAALREGWQQVGDQVFCPCHGPIRAMQARRKARFAEFRRKIEANRAELGKEDARGLEAFEILLDARETCGPRDEGMRLELSRQIARIRQGFRSSKAGRLADERMRELEFARKRAAAREKHARGIL